MPSAYIETTVPSYYVARTSLNLLQASRQANTWNLLEVRPKTNYRLFVRYEDGVSGEVDLSSYAGRSVFAAWQEPGVFEQVLLAGAGHPEWSGGIDLCPDALYMQLTGKRAQQVFPTLNHLPAHA